MLLQHTKLVSTPLKIVSHMVNRALPICYFVAISQPKPRPLLWENWSIVPVLPGPNPPWKGGGRLMSQRCLLKLVAKKGLEPLRPCGQQILSLSWLPLHHLAFVSWSEWRDLNPRRSAPKADALPGCATLRC